MANTMNFQQTATVMVDIVKQATGADVLAPTNVGEFVNVATTALQQGWEQVYRALTTVLSRTIFSVRPYTRKYRGMEANAQRYGAHIRKIKYADNEIEDNDTYKYPVIWDDTKTPPNGDGQSVDQWVIKKAKPVQTNFYGGNVFGDHLSVFTKPLEVSFFNPTELSMFLSGIMTNWTSTREQYLENIARSITLNGIAAVIDEGLPERNIYLLNEYNAQNGQNYTVQDIMLPENFRYFMEYVFTRIDQLSGMFTERSSLFQTPLTGYNINQHTPYNDQMFMIFRQYLSMLTYYVKTNVRNPNVLTLSNINEVINFFQSIQDPKAIDVIPSYMAPDGTIKNGNAVKTSSVVGFLCDREFMGYSIIDNYSRSTPLNARAEYFNIWWKTYYKAWLDNSEKAAVLHLNRGNP